MEGWPLAAVTAVAAAAVIAALVLCLRTCRRALVAQGAAALLFSAAVTSAAAAWLGAGGAASWPGASGPGRGSVADALLASGVFGATVAAWFVGRAVTDPSWRPSRFVSWTAWGLPQGAYVVAAATGTLPPDFGSVTLSLGGFVRVDDVTTFSLDRLLLLAVWCLTLRQLVLAARPAPRYARRALSTLAIGALLAAVTAASTVPEPDALGGVDHLPVALALAALLHADVLLRANLGPLVPPGAGHVLETMSDAVVVVDPVGRLVAMNAAARRLTLVLGAPVDDLLGRPVAEVMRPAVVDAVGAGQGRTTSFSLSPRSHLEARTTALLDASGHPVGTVVTCREVTDAVALRTQLEMARTELEQERARLEDLTGRLMTELSTKEQEHTRLAEDAVRDPLTGVHNRRRLHPAVTAAMARSREAGRPFAVLVVDVDHFKAVNDTHGHGVGDRVLQRLASELVIVGRPGDTVIRYGGEEFLVVVPDVGPLAAVRRAEEVRRAVGQLRVPVRAGDALVGGPADRPDDLRVTVSVGVACYPESASTVESLIEAADDALYAAKESGRDCVVSA